MTNSMSSIESEIDLAEAREFVVSLMPPAGAILRKHFRSGNLIETYKDERENVTEADLEVDRFLIKEISIRFPQSKFLTEETAPRDPSEMQSLFDTMMNESNVWINDSCDGSWNFSHGNINFAISVGLVEKGRTRLAVVYIPMADEIYFAQEDMEGAYLNGQRIYVSKTDRIDRAVFECDFPSNLEKRRQTWEMQGRVLDVMQLKTMSSAVADMASLSCGRIDAYLNDGLKPWDLAASSFLIEKAGGKVTNKKGGKFDLFKPDIFASNGILHEEFLRRWK